MLVRLPPELLCHVYSLLPPTSVNQISLTCHSLYTSALPSLYSTIVLSFRKHIRQLELSVQHNKDGFLHHVIRRYTKEIRLKCKQGGQHRLTFDIRPLLRQLPHVRTLTLVDFHMLPINLVTPLLSLLPQLEHISLRYCDLVVPDASSSSSSSSSNNNTSLPLSTTTSLELYWTDFSKAAVNALLSALPNLSKVRLLANHNRHYLANNHALVALQQHCHDVRELAIGLQEVDERTTADCIISFGKQLERLSIRCHSTLILDTITNHAPLVQDLIVRFSLDTLWYSLPALSSRPHNNNNNNNNNHDDDDDDDDDDDQGGLLYLLSHCQQLEHVQVHSMSLPPHNNRSLPTLVRQAMASVAQKQCPLLTPIHSHHPQQQQQQQMSPKTSNSNSNEDDMVHVAATTTRLTIKASDDHHSQHMQQQQQQQQQRGRRTPLVININGNTQMYSMELQQQSAKEHTRMESTLSLDSDQLKEIRALASLL